MKALALCSPGVEPLLREELKRGGAVCAPAQPGRVDFEADPLALARLLLGIRTADRVLLEAGRFPAKNFTELYDGLRALRWEDWIAKGWFPVLEKVRLGSGQIRSASSAQGIAHKAVLDRLGEAWGEARLEHKGREAGLRLYLDGDVAVAGLDLCGEPLSKRGYRQDAGEAPLKETLAAALVLWSGWKRGKPLWDPMCGSGTIVFEALLYGLNRAPNLEREFPAAAPILDAGVFSQAADELRETEKTDVEMSLLGRDRDPRMLRAAAANAGRLGLPSERLASWIRWEEAAFENSAGPDRAVLLTNPPWGTRMGGEGEAEGILRLLGKTFKEGKIETLGVVTQFEDPKRVLGLPQTSIRKVRAGGLDVKIAVAQARRA